MDVLMLLTSYNTGNRLQNIKARAKLSLVNLWSSVNKFNRWYFEPKQAYWLGSVKTKEDKKAQGFTII